MKQKDNCRIKLMFIRIAALIVIGGGHARADFIFGEPTNLGSTVNSGSSFDLFPCVSADGLELFFVSDRLGGSGAEDLWVATRISSTEPWTEPVNLGPGVNSSYVDAVPSLSTDGLELYFSSNRPGGYYADDSDIWVTTRSARHGSWDEPVNLGPLLNVNREKIATCPCISADGLELYFNIGQAAPISEWNIVVVKRETKDAPWGVPVSLGPEVNSWSCQGHVGISSDGLVLVFSDIWTCSPRPGGFGVTDIWLTRRATKDGDWGTPMNLGPPVNTALKEDYPNISADGSTLYFSRDWAADIYQAPIIPIVDFNGDRIVDAEDMCIMVDHWGTDNSLCDIGPMPWGDGVVDVQDLIVLAEHLFEQLPGRPINP